MPTENQKKLTFKNKAAKSFCPYVCYFELESVLEPTSYALNNPNCPSSTAIEQHRPSSFFLVVIEQDNRAPYCFSLRGGPDAMQKLVKLLEQLAEKFNKKKRQFPQFTANKEIHVENDNC